MNKFLVFLLLLCLQITFAQTKKPTTDIIPEPQKVIVKDGFFNLDKPFIIYSGKSTGPDDQFAAVQLQEECRQSLKILPTLIAKAGKGEGVKLVNLSVIKTGKEIKNFYSEDIRSRIGNEGYWLDISPGNIIIAANNSTGIFYGVQSLRQLIRANRANKQIPCLTITDWPGLKYRGWMVDISRGPIPTLNFLKKQVCIMAEYKQNYFNLYTEHVFKLNTHPGIAPADGISASDIKELEEYANKFHIELLGNQQCFGHMEHILEIPFYDNFSDNGWNLNPGKEEAYRFLEDLFSEVAPAYQSKLFNINCDETNALGSGKASRYVDSLGMEAVYAKHINRVNDILKKYNKRLMMWGDIAANHKEIIKQLPQDLIVLSWGYDAAESYSNAILPFKETGYEFMVAPGVSCWSQIYPYLGNAVINISNYVRDGAALGALGMMNTCWADDGENLSNYNWYGLLWGAEVSWKPTIEKPGDAAGKERDTRLSAFNKAFDKIFFGTEEPSVSGLLFSFDSIRHIPVRGAMTDWAIWSPMLEFYPENVSKEAEMNNLAMLISAQKLQAELEAARTKVFINREVLDFAIFAAKRAAYTAKKNLVRMKVYKASQSIQPLDIENARQAVAVLMEELGHLRDEYTVLWNLENRGWWLDRIKEKYDRSGTDLINLDKQVFIEAHPKAGEGCLEISIHSLYNDKPIYYTIDGSEPGIRAEKYNGPLLLGSSAIVKARVVENNSLYLVSEKAFIVHKGLGCLKILHSAYNHYNPVYAAGGDEALLDGLKGSEKFNDGHWQGYQGTDLDIEIDLKKATPVNEIQIGCLQNSYSWSLMPAKIIISASDDGSNYKEVATILNDVDPKAKGTIIKDFIAQTRNLKTRYLRLVAKNPGLLPAWHHAAGRESYIFADEIIIK